MSHSRQGGVRVAALLPLLPLLLATGCASLAYRPTVQSIGEYKNTEAVADRANDMHDGAADDVKVLVESLPDGMELKNGELAYDHARYELLGRVGAEFKNPGAVNFGWWGYGYRDKDAWRTALCAWQVPLSWVTLTMWSWFVPTYYPCRVSAGSEEERRANIVETMQRATKALGGNLLVVSGFGGISLVTGSGAVVSTTGMTSGTGYAFRVKTQPAAAEQVKGTTNL